MARSGFGALAAAVTVLVVVAGCSGGTSSGGDGGLDDDGGANSSSSSSGASGSSGAANMGTPPGNGPGPNGQSCSIARDFNVDVTIPPTNITWASSYPGRKFFACLEAKVQLKRPLVSDRRWASGQLAVTKTVKLELSGSTAVSGSTTLVATSDTEDGWFDFPAGDYEYWVTIGGCERLETNQTYVRFSEPYTTPGNGKAYGGGTVTYACGGLPPFPKVTIQIDPGFATRG